MPWPCVRLETSRLSSPVQPWAPHSQPVARLGSVVLEEAINFPLENNWPEDAQNRAPPPPPAAAAHLQPSSLQMAGEPGPAISSMSLSFKQLCFGLYGICSLSSQDLELGSRVLLQPRGLLTSQTPESHPPPFFPWVQSRTPSSRLWEGLT